MFINSTGGDETIITPQILVILVPHNTENKVWQDNSMLHTRNWNTTIKLLNFIISTLHHGGTHR